VSIAIEFDVEMFGRGCVEQELGKKDEEDWCLSGHGRFSFYTRRECCTLGSDNERGLVQILLRPGRIARVGHVVPAELPAAVRTDGGERGQ